MITKEKRLFPSGGAPLVILSHGFRGEDRAQAMAMELAFFRRHLPQA